MRTYNIALLTVVFLVFGGLFSGFWAFSKTGLIKEQALIGAGPTFVQTAQGANLDASQLASTQNAAFSSLNSVSDVAGFESADLVSYSSGAVKAPLYISPSLNR